MYTANGQGSPRLQAKRECRLGKQTTQVSLRDCESWQGVLLEGFRDDYRFQQTLYLDWKLIMMMISHEAHDNH
jgi:hypothetical protein